MLFDFLFGKREPEPPMVLTPPGKSARKAKESHMIWAEAYRRERGRAADMERRRERDRELYYAACVTTIRSSAAAKGVILPAELPRWAESNARAAALSASEGRPESATKFVAATIDALVMQSARAGDGADPAGAAGAVELLRRRYAEALAAAHAYAAAKGCILPGGEPPPQLKAAAMRVARSRRKGRPGALRDLRAAVDAVAGPATSSAGPIRVFED